MKTLTKNLLAALMTTFIAATTVMNTSAAEAGKESPATETPLTFNKILISGNVTVVIKQGQKEHVSVEGDYYGAKTSIKRKGYTLMISSAEFEPVTITVVVKDLHRIDASENAKVITAGNIDLKYLQVFLKDNARASVKANTEGLYTYIRDNADLKMMGTTREHTVLKDQVSRLNTEGLAALNSRTDSIRPDIVAAKSK